MVHFPPQILHLEISYPFSPQLVPQVFSNFQKSFPFSEPYLKVLSKLRKLEMLIESIQCTVHAVPY